MNELWVTLIAALIVGVASGAWKYIHTSTTEHINVHSSPTSTCPFCGGEGVSNTGTFDDGGLAQWIECEDCGAEGPWCDTLQEALDAWSERV